MYIDGITSKPHNPIALNVRNDRITFLFNVFDLAELQFLIYF